MSVPPVHLRGRHSADLTDPGRPSSPALAAPPTPEPAQDAPPAADTAPRHGGADDVETDDGHHTGGQSVAELLARMGVGSSGGGGRRRRRDE
jgi:hypothetical protein